MLYRTVANGAPPPIRATTTKKRSARSRNRGPHASCGLGTRDHRLWSGHPHEARILTRSWWWWPSATRGILTQTEWPRWCAHMQGWSRRIDLHVTCAPPTDQTASASTDPELTQILTGNETRSRTPKQQGLTPTPEFRSLQDGHEAALQKRLSGARNAPTRSATELVDHTCLPPFSPRSGDSAGLERERG